MTCLNPTRNTKAPNAPDTILNQQRWTEQNIPAGTAESTKTHAGTRPYHPNVGDYVLYAAAAYDGGAEFIADDWAAMRPATRNQIIANSQRFNRGDQQDPSATLNRFLHALDQA